MSGAGTRHSARRLAAGAVVVAIAGVAASATVDADRDRVPPASARALPTSSVGSSFVGQRGASGGTSTGCGPASAATVAGVDAKVARDIYANELHGGETRADVAHVTGSRALLTALAGGGREAVYAAVHAIVYAPQWHVVRLRVLRAGRVLADVGGPYVIAPVSGALRWRGRTVGTYVMSVQDDVGYVKLASRFIGARVDIYENGSFLMGTLRPAPSAVSTGETVLRGGVTYRADVLTARAFPEGTLRVALLSRTPPRAVATTSCHAVRLAAWGTLAMHIATLFRPLGAHYQSLVEVLRRATGGLAYVRTGSEPLAGGAGPARIPARGTVSYGGRSWSVFSWKPLASARG